MTTYWVDEEKDQVHSAMIAVADSIVSDHAHIYDNYKRHARLYKDSSFAGFQPGQYFRSGLDQINDTPVVYNVVRICIDTITSKISLHRPAPKFLTMGGSELLQESAKDCEKFVEGVFYECDVQKIGRSVLRDACIYGIGIAKIYEKDDRVKVSKIHPSRIIVDNQSALDGNVNQIFHTEYLTKEDLIDMFPDKEKVIDEASIADAGTSIHHGRETISVYEGYKKKIGDKVGRHVICVDSGSLVDEEYDDEELPYVIIRFMDDIIGWYGIGISEMLDSIQREMNEIAFGIQENIKLLSEPYILKHRSSNVHDDHLLSNDRARLIEWEGNFEPKVVTPPAVHPQIFQYLEELFNKAFEVIGITQMSSTGQKPAGLSAAVAMRTYLDVETQRFSVLSRSWEEFFSDVAKQIVKKAQLISERDEAGYKVQYPSKQFLGEINFKDIDLKEDQFVLQVHPASALPQSPAGRQERTIELVNSQMITPREGRQLINLPDLEKSNRLAEAPLDDLESLFEHMLSKGKYIEPIIYQDLQTGIVLGTKYYLRAKIDGLPEVKLDLILRWLDEANELMNPPPENKLDEEIMTQTALPPMPPQPMLPPQPLGAEMPGGLPPQPELSGVLPPELSQ